MGWLKDIRSGAVQFLAGQFTGWLLGLFGVTGVGAIVAAFNNAPPVALGAMVFMLVVSGYLLVTRPRSRSAPGIALKDTEDGRKAFVRWLVIFDGQGVATLHNGPRSGWQNDQQIIEWMGQEGQWVGEIVATMRWFGCSDSEIHDIGVLGPPRFLPAGGYTAPGAAVASWRAFYMDMVTERLQRLRELRKKYDA